MLNALGATTSPPSEQPVIGGGCCWFVLLEQLAFSFILDDFSYWALSDS